MSHTFGNGGVVLDTPEDIERAHLAALAGALWLEVQGMRHSQGSITAMVKRKYGLKGSKRKVFDLFCKKFNLTEFQERLMSHERKRVPPDQDGSGQR